LREKVFQIRIGGKSHVVDNRRRSSSDVGLGNGVVVYHRRFHSHSAFTGADIGCHSVDQWASRSLTTLSLDAAGTESRSIPEVIMISRRFVKWNSHHLWTSLSVSVVGLLLIGSAWAQLTEHKTVITFSTPVEVPGSTPQVLPAGTYTFKVVDSKVNRNIVQVSNKDETHVYTSILAIPTHRDTETSTTIMTFEERAAGQPQALRAWFYPYERDGQEFVYSKAQAAELAKASNSPVPFTESANYQTEPVSTTAQSAASPQSTPPVAIQSMLPTGQIGSPAPQAPANQLALATPPAPIQAQNRQASPEAAPVQTASLPQTGSTLPLLALIGCVSLFVGVSLRKWRVR